MGVDDSAERSNPTLEECDRGEGADVIVCDPLPAHGKWVLGVLVPGRDVLDAD